MSVEAIPQGTGRVSLARVVCDGCGRGEAVVCKYERRANMALVPIQGQALAKARAHGWAVVKNRLLCPACEGKRKMTAATPKPPKPEPSVPALVTPIREPTREQNRLIHMALDDAYDLNAQRYRGTATDRSIAEELGGGIMPGWVSAVREAMFGPVGNEEIAEIRGEIEKLRKATAQLIVATQADFDRRSADLEKRLEACVSAHDKRVRA